MDNDDMYHDLEEWEITTPPLYLRVWWWFWGSPAYYNRGWRYWREGLYMWIADRLPADIVSRVAMRLILFADERNLRSSDIANVVSYWDDAHAPAAPATPPTPREQGGA